MSSLTSPLPAAQQAHAPAELAALGGSKFAMLVVFLAGVLSCVQSEALGLTFVGQVYVGEVFLAIYAFWSVLANLGNRAYWERPFVWALVTLAISFSAYICSDLLNQTPTTNLLRGWARMAFLGTDLIALNAISRRHPLRILAFIMGVAVGFLLTVEKLSLDPAWYKLGIATPALLIALSLCSVIRYRHRYVLVTAVWFGLGLLNFYLDFRSLGAMCLLAGAVTLAKVLGVGRFRSLHKILLAGTLLCSAVITLVSYVSTQSSYGERRKLSNSSRWATAKGALYGISQSPWIGNGSWARRWDTDAVMHAAFAEENGRRLANEQTVAGHSQVLQVWYEAGVLAVVFFTFLLIFAVKTLWDSIFNVGLNELFGVTVYFTVNSIMGYFLSPFGGWVRYFMALDVCLCLIQFRLLRKQRAAR